MIETLEQFILIEGTDDWVPLIAMDGHARRLGFLDDSLRHKFVVDTVRRLVSEGLVLVGDLKNGIFQAWSFNIRETSEEIGEIDLRDDNSLWGGEVWVSNTPTGDLLGLAAAKEYRSLGSE